ncbi:membrane fusion protein, multidrug efflux system [Jannaschia faecimaris]|uniref:Membrane fusion protein, multidrug efflux system n=1 Tax=Jannaschia faecimaris TaxID=1244108 RepID=A0A1H3RP51_9RHOB|nr:efflux RND transporter periplasmic adaptor subunit [Jannaschia faecimaris]SDZ27534.1 membrane fusion protein, multidrug efflux system [Jannaschia faecimaris]
MRLFPIVTALLVAVALFFVVLRRDDLFRFANDVTTDGEALPVIDNAAAPAPAPVAINTPEGTLAAQAVHVVAQHSQAQDVPNAVRVRGESEAARQVTVMAETTGTVISAPIRKGAFVEVGQTLCELSPGTRRATLAEAQARLAEARARVPEAEARVPEAQARVAEAEARLVEARLNQTAAARLSEGGFASEIRLAGSDAALSAGEAALTSARTGLESVSAGIETARAGVQAAEAGVERAMLEIDYLTIEAPFSGLLETDTAELGELLQSGGGGGGSGACATIVQLNPIKLVGFLPESQVDKVALGSRAGARLASGQEVTGEVTFLSRSADETTRTFRVEVAVANEDMSIRDGQSVEIAIETDPIRAHLLPASALTLNDEGQLGLRLVVDGKADFSRVELIRDTPDGVLIAGLPDRADIITVGQEYVTDGVPVRASYSGEGQSEVSQ